MRPRGSADTTSIELNENQTRVQAGSQWHACVHAGAQTSILQTARVANPTEAWALPTLMPDKWSWKGVRPYSQEEACCFALSANPCGFSKCVKGGGVHAWLDLC